MNQELETAFRNITDTFTGTDGGVRFIKFKMFIDTFDKKANEGDEAAKAILLIVIQLSKLINIASL